MKDKSFSAVVEAIEPDIFSDDRVIVAVRARNNDNTIISNPTVEGDCTDSTCHLYLIIVHSNKRLTDSCYYFSVKWEKVLHFSTAFQTEIR